MICSSAASLSFPNSTPKITLEPFPLINFAFADLVGEFYRPFAQLVFVCVCVVVWLHLNNGGTKCMMFVGSFMLLGVLRGWDHSHYLFPLWFFLCCIWNICVSVFFIHWSLWVLCLDSRGKNSEMHFDWPFKGSTMRERGYEFMTKSGLPSNRFLIKQVTCLIVLPRKIREK